MGGAVAHLTVQIEMEEDEEEEYGAATWGDGRDGGASWSGPLGGALKQG